jgi:hypothetical protein
VEGEKDKTTRRHNDACKESNNCKMNHPTKTNRRATSSKPLGICRSLLLGTALLSLLPTLQASEWGFNLIGKPSVQKTEAPGETEQAPPEVFQMTGAGSFSPEAATASGQGTFAIFNGLEEPDIFIGGPTFRGTWKVTEFVGWTPDGGLQVRATLFFKVGLNEAFKETGFDLPILLTITEDGINVDFFFELFASESTGSAAFHPKGP